MKQGEGGATVVTAKLRCVSKTDYKLGDDRCTMVVFEPDHAEHRNAGWACQFPFSAPRIIVEHLQGAMGDGFVQGQAYTITLAESAVRDRPVSYVGATEVTP